MLVIRVQMTKVIDKINSIELIPTQATRIIIIRTIIIIRAPTTEISPTKGITIAMNNHPPAIIINLQVANLITINPETIAEIPIPTIIATITVVVESHKETTMRIST